MVKRLKMYLGLIERIYSVSDMIKITLDLLCLYYISVYFHYFLFSLIYQLW